MALRAFHSNPAIGGFGCESHEETSDAFAQIVKELVDNAVDACSAAATGTKNLTRRGDKGNLKSGHEIQVSNKRVRVSLERVEGQNQSCMGDADEGNGPQERPPDEVTGKTGGDDLLRLTICDNGCGMPDIEKCVSVFSSSKNGDDGSENDKPGHLKRGGQSQPSKKDYPPSPASKETAGRYGIGLTLCLLHAQRLVPNSCAMIKSTVENSPNWTVAKFVVDTNRDTVVCVEKNAQLKKDKTMSGTAVSLLLPGGKEAKRAWPRLAEYFARFQLSLGLKCSLEVLAPSLSKLPLFIRPVFEVEDMQRRKEQKNLTNDDSGKENIQPTVDINTKDDQSESTSEATKDITADGFIDLLENPNQSPKKTRAVETHQEGTDTNSSTNQQCTNDDGEDEGWHLELDEDFFSSASGQTDRRKPNPIGTATTTTGARNQKRQDEEIQRRVQMQKSISSYLKKPVNLTNVAHSHQNIRRNDGFNNSKANNTLDYPSLEVDIIVSDCDNVDSFALDGSEEALPQDAINSSTSHLDHDRSKAKIMLIRMVNRIPMLDSAEASACGVVRELQQKSLWNSYGLDVSPMLDSFAGDPLHVPTFSLADSAHVAPFFNRNTPHTLFESEESSDDDSELDEIEDVIVNGQHRSGKRKRNRKSLLLKPAGLRLGNLIIIVQLNSKSSQLPLPTLSKGRLPMNDSAINNALQAGLSACLRSLQKSNPSLLLTPSQLKKTERDVLYVPAIATAFSSMIMNSRNVVLRDEWLSYVQTEDELSDEKSTSNLTEMQLTRCLEDRIRKSLSSHEEERKKDALNKERLRRKSKSLRKKTEGRDSLSVSSSQYDLEHFMNNNVDHTSNEDQSNDRSSLKGIHAKSYQSDDDLKSNFSHQSSLGQSAVANTSKSINSNYGDSDADQSDDDMNSSFSSQLSMSQPTEIEVTTPNNVSSHSSSNDNDFDDDGWW